MNAEKFQLVYCEDKARGLCVLPELSCDWAYEGNKKLSEYHEGSLWDWIDSKKERPGFYKWYDSLLSDDWIMKCSRAMRKMVESATGKKVSMDKYESIVRRNVREYVVQTICGTPGTVLDFGAGWCRGVLMWKELNRDLTYVAVDGIEGPYVLQYHILRSLGDVVDYVDDPSDFKIEHKKDHQSFYHLPTWRLDLLPDGFFGLIVCVHVLHEIDFALVKEAVSHFERILSPGGRLYIQHCDTWKPVYGEDLNKYLENNGWKVDHHRSMGESSGHLHSARLWHKEGTEE